MNKKAQIEYWITSAQHDIEAMENLFSSGNYDWSLFVGHLVLEKILKARWLFDNKNEEAIPPRTHLLDKLAKETAVQFDEKTLIWLVQANDFNLETRYPDYKMEFYKKATGQFAEENMRKIKDVYKCILKTMQ